MTELRRTIKCSSCGDETSISLSSGLEMRELLVAGKCSGCGSSMQVSYSLVSDSAVEQAGAEKQPGEMVNLDDTLFSQETPSDTLKDLMEE